tara:strand:- start:2024 stop:2278 length:255 start_codon:yes stop_codon:yes gene_type:complete
MSDKNDFGRKDLLKRIKDLEARVERLEKGKSSKPKKKRKPSAYNNFFKTEMPKVKKEFPDMEHSKAFKEVSKRWKEKQAKLDKK